MVVIHSGQILKWKNQTITSVFQHILITCHLGGPFSLFSSPKETVITGHVTPKYPF